MVRIIDLAIWSAIAVHTTVALVSDLRTRRIPNRWNVIVGLAGLGYHSIMDGSSGLQYTLMSMALMLALSFTLQLCGAIGGGDVKWFAALGAWSGLRFSLTTFMLTMIIAGLIGAVMLVVRGQLWLRLKSWLQSLVITLMYRNADPIKASRKLATIEMPLMIAVAPAVILSYLQALGGWMQL